MALFLNAMLETDGITVVHELSKGTGGTDGTGGEGESNGNNKAEVAADVRAIAKALHEKIVPMIWHM